MTNYRTYMRYSYTRGNKERIYMNNNQILKTIKLKQKN